MKKILVAVVATALTLAILFVAPSGLGIPSELHYVGAAAIPMASAVMMDDLALIPDRLVAADLGIGLRALSDREKTDQDFPQRYRVRNRNYRLKGEVRIYKERHAVAAEQGNAGWKAMQKRPRLGGRFSAVADSKD
jgi:hypothetical protein